MRNMLFSYEAIVYGNIGLSFTSLHSTFLRTLPHPQGILTDKQSVGVTELNYFNQSSCILSEQNKENPNFYVTKSVILIGRF